MKSKILFGALATAFTFSISNVVAQTTDNTTGSANTTPATDNTTTTATQNNASMQSQLDNLKAQIADLESKVNTEVVTNSQLQAELKKDESQYANLDDRMMGVRQEAGYSVPGFGTGRNFGLDSAEDGSETLITAPQLNKDFNLLLQNQFVNKQLGDVSQTGARVQFSGTVQASYEANSEPLFQTEDDVDDTIPEQKSDLLAQAEFDLSAQVNDWITGYIHFFSNTEPGTTVQLEQGFIVLGNFDRSPTYASFGKEFVSSGSYATNMISRPLTREVGRFRANEATIGTIWEGFRANIFGYDNERQVTGSSDKVNQWGAQIEYFSDRSDFFEEAVDNDKINYKMGIAYVNDISVAEGIEADDVLPTSVDINSYIPAGNIYGRLAYGEWSLLGEYQHSFDAFETDEIAMNGDGAQISAVNVELTYRFDLGRPSWLTANYGQSVDSLALLIPQRVWGVTYGINILKNTVLSFEYLLEQDYSNEDVGFAVAADTPTGFVFGTGENNNQFIAQIDMFF